VTIRAVSLVPSVTETLLAWGVTPIACTRFCEQPDLRHVGGTKDPDIAAIAALRPDVVVVDEEENRREDADALTAAGIPVHALAIRSVADVGPALARLAALLAVDSRAQIPMPATGSVGGGRLRVFVPIWRRPWMTINADTYGSSLLDAVGAVNVFAAAGTRYPNVTLEEAAAAAPDVVLAPSEPYPFTERQRAELELVAPVEFVDGKDLFWWGARTPAATERLRAVVARLGG
jgi:ABC-type Fe3+-hydroxamate transport system substrate-binding protein